MLVSGGSWVGIDVSRAMLDVCVSSTGTPFRVPNSPTGLVQLIQVLRNQDVGGVVLEHTGQYSEPVWWALRDADFHPSLIHPNYIVNFRKSGFGRAKTDRSDARLLATYGEERRPRISVCRTETEQNLHNLVHQRRALVKMRISSTQRVRSNWMPELMRVHDDMVDVLTSQIGQLEHLIRLTIASDLAMQHRAALLQSVKGIGLVRSATILADLPELGTLNGKKIAMLVGLAPIANDSGQSSKHRYTAGGRAQIRGELVLLVRTPRSEPVIRARRAAMLGRHEHTTKTDCAVARWLITILNVMVRDGLRWDELDCVKGAVNS